MKDQSRPLTIGGTAQGSRISTRVIAEIRTPCSLMIRAIPTPSRSSRATESETNTNVCCSERWKTASFARATKFSRPTNGISPVRSSRALTRWKASTSAKSSG
jgi:hypothetical protein